MRLKVKEIAEEKFGFKSSYQIMKAWNLPPSKASRLWKGDMKAINIDTLEFLCKKLDTDPNTLLGFKAKKK